MHRATIALLLSVSCACSDGSTTAAIDGGSPAIDAGDAVAIDASADAPAAPDAHVEASTDASPDAAIDPPGVFVAVGYGGRRMRSIDYGRTWQDDQSIARNGGDDTNLLRTIAFGNGRFIAAGWLTFSSPDGKTWTELPATHQNWFGSLVYAQSTWVAVGGYGMRLTSADATTWADHAIDTAAAHPHGCLVYAGSAFVACNDDGKRSWSASGSTWTYATGADGIASSELAVGNGIVVGIDGVDVVVSHDAGKTWARGATLDATGGGLVFANGTFTYLATGAVFTSSDATHWTKHASPNARPSALAYGHGTYVAVRAHEWHRSTDGITWDVATKDTATDNAFEWVAFGAP